MRSFTHFFLFTSCLGVLTASVAGCGVRTALEIHADAGDAGTRPDAFGRDMGPPPPMDAGSCTSDFQCDDGRLCDGVEACVGGRCQSGPPLDCQDGISCTSDQCVEGAGCVSRPDDSLCPPGLRCDPFSGCVPNTMRCSSDFECDDRQACNGVERCDPGSGTCFSGTPMFCGDGVSCTDDFCVEGFGCTHSANSAECPLGQICDVMAGCQTRPCDSTGGCDDGDPCNGSEFCTADGRCVGGSPLFCEDGNPCTVDFCVTGRGCTSTTTSEICGDGADNDCNGLTDCGDPFCAMSPGCGTCVPVAPFEFACSDGRDDDCNGLTDCVDPQCAGRPECGPCGPFEFDCFNGRDDDCNGLVDCRDPVCGSTPGCGGCIPRSDREFACFDGMDDDCDGLFDCTDPDCAGPMCGVCSFPEDCHNGIDDDCNGPADCMDPFCVMTDPSCGPVCVPTSPFERRCSDGIDDDCDMRIDCADRDCRGRPGCSDAGTPPIDAGFLDGGGPTTNELGVAMCTNGRDDDGDGRTDCADPDCRPFGPMGECCNGVDDTGDGNIDEFTCRCFDNSFCPTVGSLDQVCWVSSFSICAPRCNFYGGNSFCAENLPSTPTCNFMTGECE